MPERWPGPRESGRAPRGRAPGRRSTLGGPWRANRRAPAVRLAKVRALSVAMAATLVAIGCAPSSEDGSAAPSATAETTLGQDSTAPGADAESDLESDAESNAASDRAPVGLDAGVRIGRGRAVAAATAGPTTVVATTIGAQAQIDGRWYPLDQGDAGQPTGLDLSADGTRAVLWWPDHVQLWSVEGEPSLVQRIDAVEATAHVAGSEVLIVTDQTLTVIDQETGTELARHDLSGARRFGPVAADPAGQWWAAAISDPVGPVELLVAGPGVDPTAQIIAGRDELMAFQIEAGPTGRRVAIGLSQDGQPFSGGEIVVWDLDAEAELSAHPLDLGQLWTTGSDGGLIVVGQDSVTSVGPGGAAGQPQTLPEGFPPFAVHGRPDGHFLVIRQDGSRLVVDGDRIEADGGPAGRFVLASQAAGVPSTVSVVDQTGAITVFDDGDPGRQPARQLDDLVAGTINDLEVSPRGVLAAATSTGSIGLLTDPVSELLDGEGDGAGPAEATWTSQLVNDEGNVDSVAFSPDGDQLVSGVAQRRSPVIFDDTVAVWDLADERRVFELGGEREEVQGCSSFANIVRLAADGSFLVGVSHDFTVFVLDGATYQPRHLMEPHAAPILDVALSPDDRWLVTTSEDSTMRVWDLETGELAADYPTILSGYRSIDFLADRDHLLAVDRQGVLSILDPMTGEVRSTFESIVSGASDVDVSPDGRLVAAGDGSSLRVWDADSGRVVREFVGHHGSVTTAAFTPDGSAVVSGSNDGTAIIWPLAS